MGMVVTVERRNEPGQRKTKGLIEWRRFTPTNRTA
jgi:hypothetical protein